MYRGSLIDADVHHGYRSNREIVERLPKKWRDYVTDAGGGVPISLLPDATRHYGLSTPFRMDSLPPEGHPGTDPETTLAQLQANGAVQKAVLTYQVGFESAMANPYLAAAVCRALNEWTAERWLSTSTVFAGTILVSTELTTHAVEEIEYWAGDRRFAAVLMIANPFKKPLGHPVYHSIYGAAETADLPVIIHVGGEFAGKGGEAAGGAVGTYLENYNLLCQPAMHYIVSLITHGVFSKFPTLKILFSESGFTWLPSIVWRLDSSYTELRRESPYATELPSETLREHVRLTTQPLDYVLAKSMVAFLESFPAFEDMLCFSSDYPHHDQDEIGLLSTHVPKLWHSRVFCDNAQSLFALARREGTGQRVAAME